MNATNHNDRYPGARPFTDTEHDRLLFFGRDQEISALLYQVLSVHLLILYGKSGLGKTSLLQAGVFPRLREQNFLPLPVRLNRPELPLMTVLTDEINKTCSALGIDYTPGETAGLWEFFKTAVFWCGDSLQTPVLVLDQFEEIFTLQSVDNRRWLARELGDLIGSRLPQRVRERLQLGEELPYSDKPPAVKIILSLREDYLGALQELTTEAPQILNDRFRLTPLNRAQARLAVVEPAQFEAAEFFTQAFTYDDGAIEEILNFLGGKSGEIEPFQLQVLCRQMEQKVQQEQAQGKRDIRVDRAYLGGRKAMEKILQNFYLDAIRRLPKRRLRRRARLLCEEGLLSPEGYRVSLVENNIKKVYKLRPPALQTLVDARLLRKEERLESYYYELSHDSLTQPILHSRPRWRMPRSFKIGLGVVGLILLLSGSGYLWIWYSEWREDLKYYNAFAKRLGRPVGVGQLTLEQVKHRAVSLKFIRHGIRNPIEKVIAINSREECNANNGVGTYFKSSLNQFNPLHECQWRFIYDSQEQVVYEKAYNKLEKMVWGFVYSPSIEADKKHAHYVGQDGFPRPQSSSSSEFVEFTYSPEGDEILRTYFDRLRNPQQGPDKEFRRQHEFYPNGLVKKITSLDSDGRPMNDAAGNSGLRLVYDSLGNTIEAIAFDADGRPVRVKDGWCKFTAKYDEHGNQIEWAYFDTAGQPTLHKDGYHRSTAKYDKHGNKIEWVFFDAANQPMTVKDGYHLITGKYDERGNQIEWAYFDIVVQPILHKDGYHRSTAKYDERDNPIEWAYFDTDGKPTLDKIDRTHKMTARYDERGNQSEWAYFDAASQPILHKDGYHRSTAKYDERGNKVEWAYFDAANRPMALKNGYHLITGKYDERGNRIEWAYFDTDGKSTIDQTDGTHKMTAQYDERGNQIEWAYFDTAGQPTLHKDGYHRSTARYDERGNQIEWTYFDTAGQPTLHKDGYHRSTVKYDGRGNKIEWAYFDAAGQPTLHKDGYHRSTAKYDERGNRIEWVFFDAANRPIALKDGYHLITSKYDERGNQIEWTYFDTAGQPTLHKDGYYKSTVKYDERGNKIEWAYFDAASQPTLHKDGYHRSTAKYDERGNQIEWAYFDTANRPMALEGGYHLVTSKYDEHGNQIEWIYFDTAGQPTLHKDDYHRSTARYDERGNQIEQIFYGINGELVSSSDGFKKKQWRYYPGGQKAEEIVIGLDGSKGFTKQITRYDEAGQEVYQGFFDDQDKPAHTNKNFTEIFGYSEITSEYRSDGRLGILRFSGFEPERNYATMVITLNNQGKPQEIAYFDATGKPASDQNDFHKLIAQYDEHGNRTEQAYYGINGELVSSSDGFKKKQWRYYPGGKKAEEIVIGLDGSKGFTKQITRYDEVGREVYQGFFDDQDKPAYTNQKFTTPFGYSETTSEYAPSGKLIITHLTGFEPYWGYAQMMINFDEEGNPLKSTCFDSNGQPVETEVLVTFVLPDRPAAKMGIKAGDVFIDYDGKPIKDVYHFIIQRQEEPADDPPKELHVRRDGEILSFWISPGKIGVGLQGRGIISAATHSSERQ